MATTLAARRMAKKTKPPEQGPDDDKKGKKITDRKPMIVQVRGSLEYKAWVEELAAKEGDTLAKLFDRGVRKIAREIGFPDPPKR